MKWNNEAQVATPSISEVHFTRVRPRDGLIGFASFVINNAFAVSGVGIHTRPDGSGIRLLYPAKKFHDGSDIKYFHPINRDIGAVVEAAVYVVAKKLIPQVIQ